PPESGIEEHLAVLEFKNVPFLFGFVRSPGKDGTVGLRRINPDAQRDLGRVVKAANISSIDETLPVETGGPIQNPIRELFLSLPGGNRRSSAFSGRRHGSLQIAVQRVIHGQIMR